MDTIYGTMNGFLGIPNIKIKRIPCEEKMRSDGTGKTWLMPWLANLPMLPVAPLCRGHGHPVILVEWSSPAGKAPYF